MSTSKVKTTGLNYPAQCSEQFMNCSNNVIDKYKSFSIEEIKADLQKSVLPGAVLMTQMVGDFNISNVIRTANFFNLSKVYYIGNRKIDRRGCVGTYKYTDVCFLPTFQDLIHLKKEYQFVALENNINKPTFFLKDFIWVKKSLIIIGEEGCGISEEILDLCDQFIEIENRGSVRSLNAATAAAIAINDYATKCPLTSNL